MEVFIIFNDIMKLVYIYIVCFVFMVIPQDDNRFTTVVNTIEKEIVSYNTKKALHIVDSVLVADVKILSTPQKNTLETLKVEALTKANLFEASLQLSKELSQRNSITPQQKVRILINNALAYEYVGKFDVCKEKLDEIKAIYTQQKIVKNELYAQYLYRTSSFYRVQRKYDSLALTYATKAKEFSVANNYKNEGAVASMLLGFLARKDNLKLAEEHFKIGLQFWKEVNDYHGIGGMYMALSGIKEQQKKYNEALMYCDSTILVEKPHNYFGELAYAYNVKSNLLEKTGRLKEALASFKTFQEYQHKSDLNEQEIKVNELVYASDIEKAKLNNAKIAQELLEQKKRGQRFLYATLALLFFSAIFMYLTFRIKLKNNKIKQQRAVLNDVVSQKELLLKELHHRVKNNLSMILSLIKLQTNKLKTPEGKALLENLEKRIETIAITHNQFLYKEDNTKHSLKEYIDKVIFKLVNLNPSSVEINASISNDKVSIDTALPIGIIINELITNSLKHAKVTNELVLNIDVKRQGNSILISYSDNGLPTKTTTKKENLGLFLINSMVKQLRGSYQKNQFSYTFDLQIKNE